MDSPIANLVQQGTSLRPDMTIQHDDLHEDPEQAIQQTMQVCDPASKPMGEGRSSGVDKTWADGGKDEVVLAYDSHGGLVLWGSGTWLFLGCAVTAPLLPVLWCVAHYLVAA